jgi:hypothetical protein
MLKIKDEEKKPLIDKKSTSNVNTSKMKAG